MDSVRGVLLMPQAMVEAGAALVPGSQVVPCARCGVDCIAAPSSLELMAAGAAAVCLPCVRAESPAGWLGVLSPAAQREVELLERLGGQAGNA